MFCGISGKGELFRIDGKPCICITCSKSFMKAQKPKFHESNGLELEEIQDELNLGELGSNLIAKEILIMKIYYLPTSKMDAVSDKVVNVVV